MKRSYPVPLVFGIIFLFFIQAAGTLVESIYILDLMNSTLDENALAVLFFFTPALLIPFHKRYPRPLIWSMFAVLFLTRSMLPYLNTASRVLASGLATFAALSLFFLLIHAKPKGETRSRAGLWGSAGLALAVSLSALLRTADHGLDYSLIPAGGWTGWGLGLLLGGLLTQLDPGSEPAAQKKSGKVTAAITGIFLLLTLVWFAFSAPAVIARWTEGNYTPIVITVSLFAAGWVLLSLGRPQLPARVSLPVLLAWNLLFTLCLTGTILAQRVHFPPTPGSASVTVGTPTWMQQFPLALMLLFFPVIFLDMQIFLDHIKQAAPAPRDLVPGILLGSAALILLVFAHIFTNVWGYVEPVSTPFRNKFWLPYFLMAGLLTVLIWRTKRIESDSKQDTAGRLHWGWAVLLGAIFLSTALSAMPGQHVQAPANQTSLVVMTFNTQQSNDAFGEKSFDRQLALIRRASPDILALQESDSTRISLNNNDYVRYFAEKLSYYSYYGPTTVTGTYGTAILSKYPLLNTRTVFTYSDQDEIGTAEAEIEVNGRRFTIHDVHPDGSDTAMLVFAHRLLERSREEPYVIALGDYNLRDYEEAYQLMDGVYTNAWTSVYPTEISTDGVDMSGENRIDHIFVSPALGVRDPVYVLAPESATDHAVHWTEIYWENP